jgi:hypothetical protein
MRFLQSTVRVVSGDDAAYRAAWAELRERATRAGVRAWLFRDGRVSSRFIEFLEWQQSEAGDSPMLDAELRERSRALAEFGPGITDQWLET